MDTPYSIDLSTAKLGDEFTSNSMDTEAIFLGANSDNQSGYPYVLALRRNGSFISASATYTRYGKFYTGGTHSYDLTGKIPKCPAIPMDVIVLAGFKMPEVKPRREDSRGPEYGYYEAEVLRDSGSVIVTRCDIKGIRIWNAEVDREQLVAFMSDQP